MMFKMCGRQRAWEAQGLRRPRQVFLTQSRFLVEKVEDDFIKLSNSLAMAKRKSVEEPVAGIFSHGDELLDLDEEEYWSNDLPKEFSALEEKHFPLFITYDHVRLSFLRIELLIESSSQLCRLLEGDFAKEEGFVGRVGTRGNILDETADLSCDYMERRKAAFVSYDVFLSSYWAHFPEPLRKRLGILSPRQPHKSPLISMASHRSSSGFRRVYGSDQGFGESLSISHQDSQQRCLCCVERTNAGHVCRPSRDHLSTLRTLSEDEGKARGL